MMLHIEAQTGSTLAYRASLEHCKAWLLRSLRITHDGRTTIFLGDFNLHVTSTKDEYAPLNTILARYQAFDVLPQFGNSLDNTYTDWQAGNSLTWLLDQQHQEAAGPHG